MCGVVEDGILPGLFGFEAGQSAVGDILAWFTDALVPPAYHQARSAGIDLHAVLEREADRPPRARAGCSRSIGGTATARSSSTRTCRGC